MSGRLSSAPAAGRNQGLGVELVLASVGIHVLALALPLALLQVYDRILPSQQLGTVTLLALGVGSAILLEAFLRHARTALLADRGARLEAGALQQLQARLQRADAGAMERLGAAGVIDGVRSVSQLRDEWSGQARLGLYDLPFVALYLGLIAWIGGWLVLIPLALYASAGLLSALLAWRAKDRAVELERAEAVRRDLLWSVFSSPASVKSQAAEADLVGRFRAADARHLRAHAAHEIEQIRMRELGALVAQLSTILVVVFGATEVIAGSLTSGGLSACTLLAGRSLNPIMGALALLGRRSRFAQALLRFDALARLPDATPGNGTLAPAGVPEDGGLAVRIATPAGAQEVRPGDCVVLRAPDPVRASSLLARLGGLERSPDSEAPDALQLSLGGRPLAEWGQLALAAQVAWVPARPGLHPGSYLDNLTHFDARLRPAAMALADELGLLQHLDKLGGGVLTVVGQVGADGLDPGIAQRIALVRALLRQPRLLLLDQAGAGLDIDGERRLAAMLVRLKGRTTMMLVTHRPALRALADRELDLQEHAP